jgi:hypothetical protein
MTDTTVPLGPASASSSAAAPRWRRRLDALPGVIDVVAAHRLYRRTAGWAIQRIARIGDLVARYAGVDHGGAGAELPLARVPAKMSGNGEPGSEYSAAGVGRSDAVEAGHHVGSTAHDAPAADHLARARAPTLARAPARTQSTTLSEASVSVSGARPLVLARKIGDSQTRGPAEVSDPEPTARTAASAAAVSSRDIAGAMLPLAQASSGVPVTPRVAASSAGVSTLRRKPSGLQIDTPVLAPPASREDARDVAPVAFSLSGTDATALHQQPKHDARASAAATSYATSPIITPLVHRAPGGPLTLARMRDEAWPDRAAPRSARVERVMGRAAEISIAAPSVPSLIWRSPDNDARKTGVLMRADAEAVHGSAIVAAPSPPSIAAPSVPTLIWRSPGNDARSTAALMRAGAEAVDGSATVAAPRLPASVPAPQTDAATSAAPASTPDVNHLADQVTRLIVRRLEIECERRGGKRWN